MTKARLLLLILFLLPTLSVLQATGPSGVTLSGYITDNANGESLPGATIYMAEQKTGTAANDYGYYSMTLPPGTYHLTCSFLGYQDYLQTIELKESQVLNIALTPSSEQLQEVEVTGEAKNENIISTQMSVNTIDAKTIQSIPALMGEVDLIKALQLLPGVKFVAEGSSGISVRGGGPDQNLMLLDEATIYNAGHLLGFFSVFNNDAVRSVDLYKGDMPAEYGGRLSSLIDVRMKEGDKKQLHGTGGIGLISSRLMLEGPIEKERSSFMVSGRRSYADLFLRLSPNQDINQNTLYFYDLNAKVNFTVNNRNHLYASGYIGRDVFKSGRFGMNWGNATGSLRWNHLFGEKLFSNFTFVASRFNYQLGVNGENSSGFDWRSTLDDYMLKGDFQWFPNTNNTVTFGFSSIIHNFFPGTIKGVGDSSFVTEYALPKSLALESAVWLSNEQHIGSRLTLRYGMRFSIFNNFGPATVYQYNSEGLMVDSVVHSGHQIYQTYINPEPRIGLVFKINEISSVKASYSYNTQYIQQAQNSTAGSPLNIWFPSSPNVLPQLGQQVAAGYFRNFSNNVYQTSVEGYYKFSDNAIDYRDHADLLLNKYFEGELLYGKDHGYGLEFMVRRVSGPLTGWIGYTWSRSFRQIQGINDGKVYPAPYDRPNDLSVVVNYDLSNRISFGGTWVYSTGNPVTFPVGRMVWGTTTIPVYSSRNGYRMPDYHRLDLSFTWRQAPDPNRRWNSEFNVSVYNAYNRKNPWVINFQSDPDNPEVTYAEATYLFGIIPSITYNFKF